MQQYELPFLNRICLIVFLISFSCTLTTTKPKDPVFSVDLLVIKQNIDSLIKFERVNFGGREIKKNGQLTTELVVEIINPVNEPTDKSDFKKLTRQIAKITKEALKAPDYFDIYKILFIKRKSGDIINRNDSHGSIFKNDEL